MNRPRVLIAEDFVLIQEMIRALLEPECDVVAAVEDSDAALQAVVAHRPDVLLADISLPGESGFALAEKLRDTDPDVKVVVVTGYRDRNYVEKAFAAGAKGYVLKSTIVADLLPAIREVIAGGVYRSQLLT